MAANLTVTLTLLLTVSQDIDAQNVPTFMGRKLITMEPKREADGMFPMGPASVCIMGPPQRQCYTAPEDFGNAPKVAVVQVKKGTAAILFAAASGGTSGWRVHLALLRPAAGKDLEDLFASDIEVSNQSQHAFWSDPSISNALIFVTADFVWGPDETHYDNHRYMVSAYVNKQQALTEDESYFLEDSYMTAKKYNLDAKADVLASEKQEILTRLKRVAPKSRTTP
jgi:hypothetical protein